MRPTASGQSALLLLDVIELLNERNINFAIVGAFAASYYGMVRASLDADAVISLHTLEEAAGLCKDMRDKGWSISERRGDAGDPIAAVINIQDRFRNRVDLLLGIRGMDREVFDRAQKTEFMGMFVKIVGCEDFIAMKIYAGSPKDLQDVIGVIEVSGDKIDRELLKKLTSQYGKDCVSKLRALLKESTSD